MIGYGVTTSGQESSTSFGNMIVPAAIEAPRSQNQPKKELTLLEKQQLASKLEKEALQNQQQQTSNGLTQSNSMQNMKTKTMTDNLLDRNLADLSLSSLSIFVYTEFTTTAATCEQNNSSEAT